MKSLILNQLQSRKQGMLLLAAFSLTIVLSFMLLVPGQSSASETNIDYAAQTLRVGVWIDGLDEGDVLDRGEEMPVGFQTNEDSYAVVYRINTDGLVSILWPRSRLDDGFVFGGHEYFVPVSGARRLAASSSSGEGFIEAIVSQYPFDLRNLAVDFHHEFNAEPEDFYITGDPFLAMNEVNFAITGMEDSGDYVVTNYLSYYVHEVVDHPRYLCNQCHMDDELAVDPYRYECTIDITNDFSWGNRWYHDYGYYPVYHNPVYVYIDPWTYRPWINFWYDPFYVCAHTPGYAWNYPVYTWNHSPYYGKYGNRVKTGRGLYRSPNGLKDRHHKEYDRVTGQVARRGLTDSERNSMRQKQPVRNNGIGSGRGGQSVRPNDNPVVVRGEKPMVRPRPVIEKPTRGTSRGGLQIRNVSSRKPRTGSNSQVESRPVRNEIQVTPGVRPGRGGSVGGISPSNGTGNTTVRGNSQTRPGNSNVKPSSGANAERRIKPVKPRKKGTRIWNSGSGNQNNSRNSGRSVEPRRNSGSRNSSGNAVKPRNNSSSSGSRKGSSSTVKPKKNNRSSSGSKSSSSGTKVRSKSNSSSKSSSGNSSPKSSSRGSSGKSRSSGGSKSSGGGSKSSRSGGSSTRR